MPSICKVNGPFQTRPDILSRQFRKRIHNIVHRITCFQVFQHRPYGNACALYNRAPIANGWVNFNSWADLHSC